jgi:uncharacterized protein YdhG (YjbR/CyaY superfamily)
LNTASNTKYQTTDEYISTLPKNARDILKRLRSTIKQAALEAEEVISYNMPAFRYYGIVIYYAAHKEHIGLYPANIHVIEQFRDDLKPYKPSKGTIKFPLEKPIPLDLVKRIVEFRVKQNLERAR